MGDLDPSFLISFFFFFFFSIPFLKMPGDRGHPLAVIGFCQDALRKAIVELKNNPKDFKTVFRFATLVETMEKGKLYPFLNKRFENKCESLKSFMDSNVEKRNSISEAGGKEYLAHLDAKHDLVRPLLKKINQSYRGRC